MADPIVVKVSDLDEISELASDDLFEVVDASEGDVTKKTKKLSASKMKLFNADQISDGIVASSKLADDSVSAAKVAGSAIGTSELADGAVTTAKITDANVTLAKLASNSVDASKIVDGSVGTSELADAAVINSKLSAINRNIDFLIMDFDETISTGDGKYYWTVPIELNGGFLLSADIALYVVSTSGAVTLQLNNGSVDILTTKPSIDQGEYTSYTGTRGVVSTSYRTLSTGMRIRFDVDSSGTGAKGLEVKLVVQK